MTGAQGPIGPGSVAYYAEQNGTLITGAIGSWADVPGAAVAFNTTDNATLDLFAMGATSGVQGTSSWTRCGGRFTVDGVPTGNATYGDVIVSPARNEGGPGEWTPFSYARRVSVAAGNHTVKAQFARTSTSANLDMACEIDAPGYSGIRLYVTVR